MTPIRSVCVYCGSQDGRDESHAAAARAMGDALVDRGMRLVFGGGHVGMMGQIADSVLARGGEAIGVIPEALMRAEAAEAAVKARMEWWWLVRGMVATCAGSGSDY